MAAWRRPKSVTALFKKGVNYVLLLLHKLLTLLEAIAIALDVDDGAMVQDAVKDGGGDGDVGKDLIPL
jgi:hypothetical protein